MEEHKSEEGKVHEQGWENHMAAGLKGMRTHLKHHMKHFPGKEFRTHTRAARREMLLAFRSLLDEAIDRLEEKPEKDEPKSGHIVIE